MFDYRFPKDVTWRLQWLTSLRRVDEYGNLWQPGVDAVLCSEHFYEHDFYYQFSRKLVKPGTLPTRFNFSITGEKLEASESQLYAGTVANNFMVTSWHTLTLANKKETLSTHDEPFEVDNLNSVPSCDETRLEDVSDIDMSINNYASKRHCKVKQHLKHLRQTATHGVCSVKNSRRLRSGVSNALTELRRTTRGNDREAYFNNLQRTDQLDSFVHCPSVSSNRVYSKLGNMQQSEMMHHQLSSPRSLYGLSEEVDEISDFAAKEVSIKIWNCEVRCLNWALNLWLLFSVSISLIDSWSLEQVSCINNHL